MKKQKIVLITGGSRGLGRDMAVKMAKKGLDIVITFHSNKEAASTVVEEIIKLGRKGTAIQLDTRDISTFDNFMEEFTSYLNSTYGESKFDYLVNNAGTGVYQPLTETSEEQFDEMYNIHFKGVYFLTQKSLPFINNGGSIINVSTGLTRFSLPGYSAYASMKGAIEVYTHYLAKELGNRQVTANTLAPGAIATDFGGGSNRDDEEKRSLISSVTALGRVGNSDDIGNIAAFLCSEESHWVNALRIEASGGTLI